MKILKSRVAKSLMALIIIGIILGFLLYFAISKADKTALSNSLKNYFILMESEEFNYKNGLFNTILYNFKYLSIIWLCGIIFIFSIFTPIILLLKSINIGFSFINIIAIFKLKGILYGITLLIPSLVNIFILLLMSFYSLRFAYKVFHTIKNNISINLKNFIKNYVLIYLILSFSLLISGIIETYIISNILKFMI